MPTSLSQEADGQLKNKNIVSTEHSKFKKKKKMQPSLFMQYQIKILKLQSNP